MSMPQNWLKTPNEDMRITPACLQVGMTNKKAINIHI